LARKYAQIFVRGHYLFREANSFPRAKLEENCELRGTALDNVQGQISEQWFLQPNWGCCVHYPSVLKIGEYPRIFPSFSWGIFAHVTHLDQSCASENIIWWIIILIINEILMNFNLVPLICLFCLTRASLFARGLVNIPVLYQSVSGANVLISYSNLVKFVPY